METVLQDFFKIVEIGRKQAYKNMVMYPVLSDYSTDLDYLLLDEAFQKGLLR